jgi:hypothetical protein
LPHVGLHEIWVVEPHDHGGRKQPWP